ncbi:protease inhibitor I42 family protein [Nocardia panacis]|uniref:protease inhibitor I42 family protein n=1 Tax=Nocardia panacis TaxID=2340916 RepID=UPI00131584CF|nr:protease inhibitor I42 family protein [Nocardia panacis]
MREALVVVLLGVSLVACGKNDGRAEAPPAAVAVTETDSGQERTLRPGEALSVTLPANPSTGYAWRIADLDRNVLGEDGDPDYRPDPKTPVAPGSGGTAVLRFVAKDLGATRLNLDYSRPWEQGMEPAQKFSLTIKVL